jgi:Domain of unknown function (DUF4385)
MPMSNRRFDYTLDYKQLDLRQQPNLYRVGRGEQGVLLVYDGLLNSDSMIISRNTLRIVEWPSDYVYLPTMKSYTPTF